MFGLIVTLIIVGLVAGAIARLLVPGTGGIPIVTTIIIGIVGSFVGDFWATCCSTRTATRGSSSRRG